MTYGRAAEYFGTLVAALIISKTICICQISTTSRKLKIMLKITYLGRMPRVMFLQSNIQVARRLSQSFINVPKLKNRRKDPGCGFYHSSVRNSRDVGPLSVKFSLEKVNHSVLINARYWIKYWIDLHGDISLFLYGSILPWVLPAFVLIQRRAAVESPRLNMRIQCWTAAPVNC